MTAIAVNIFLKIQAFSFSRCSIKNQLKQKLQIIRIKIALPLWPMRENPVVLFDGVCNYCSNMVNFAIRNDKKAVLQFTALQSKPGLLLKEKYHLSPEIDSVILIDGGNVYTYSDATIRIAKYFSWPANMIYGLIIVPPFIRQPFYKWVARNRYKWFGKKETCMMPTPELRARFLD